MDINFGFSYVGLIFLIMLMIPNIIMKKDKTQNYEKYIKIKNKILVALTEIGELLITALILIFSDFNINSISKWSIFLLIAFVFIILYEIHWMKFFRSNKTIKDFYSALLGVPVAGATLPVISFLFLGIYGKNIFLILSTIIFGIGYIGTFYKNLKQIEQ